MKNGLRAKVLNELKIYNYKYDLKNLKVAAWK